MVTDVGLFSRELGCRLLRFIGSTTGILIGWMADDRQFTFETTDLAFKNQYLQCFLRLGHERPHFINLFIKIMIKTNRGLGPDRV
jgi:hypothetical protein